MTEAIQVHTGPEWLSPDDVKRQVALIQDVMRSVMREGEHYGTIPGCGDKPALLQPGAQILGLTFRIGPRFHVDERTLERGHREFMVRCEGVSVTSGMVLGEGWGFATTMESRWRFRSGPVEFTGQPVPEDYWDNRQTNPGLARKAIGGDGFAVRKHPDTGTWEIVKAGEKVEHDNPADYYNTALKISCKRAFVHMILNTLAASDMFTQDLDDLLGDDLPEAPQPGQPATPQAPAAPLVSKRDAGRILALADELGHSTKDVLATVKKRYHVDSVEALSADDAAQMIAGFQAQVQAKQVSS